MYVRMYLSVCTRLLTLHYLGYLVMQLEEESKQKLLNAHAYECEKDVCVCVCVCARVCMNACMQLSVVSRHRFCRGFVSVSIKAQQRLRSVGLHPSTPPFHHTPWGLLSWLLDRTAIMATSSYGVPCGLYTWRGQGAQQPLTPGLSGVGLASPPI